ncbi:hypothetical protein Tco_0006246 [Tanacetum coccineum]
MLNQDDETPNSLSTYDNVVESPMQSKKSNNMSPIQPSRPRVSSRLSFFQHTRDSTNSVLHVVPDDDQVGLSSSSNKPQRKGFNVARKTSGQASSQGSPLYLDFGDCDQVCEYCYAEFWYAERLKVYSPNGRTKYNRCCRGGQVNLPHPREAPEIIKELFKDKHFMENIRAYNMMFAMTSFGDKVDDSVNNGSGPYVFKVAGQISHWMGSLCPPSDQNTRFLQMYIYDTNNEVSNRLRYFGGGEYGDLKPEIGETLIQFKTIYNSGNRMRFDAPDSRLFGAIVYDSGPRCKNDFDIIIYMKDGLEEVSVTTRKSAFIDEKFSSQKVLISSPNVISDQI